jgi:hypothetical protein
MSKKKNILTRDVVLESSKLIKSGLTSNKADFLFKVLEETFEEVEMPEDEEFANPQNIHPIVWMLIDTSGKSLHTLFKICLEISIVKNITNYEKVLKDLKNPFGFNGALAEIYVGSRIRTATNNVNLILEKDIKQPDYEIVTGNHSFYVEVKGSSETDFEIGLDKFDGCIRGSIEKMLPNDGIQRIIRFGESWVGGIASACAINPKIENVSWALHSSMMSLVNKASQIIYEQRNKHNFQTAKLSSDIEIISIGKIEENDLPIKIEMPQAKRVASIGNIIQKLTCKKNYDKFNNGNGVFAFYNRIAVDKTISHQLLTTLLIQCLPLRKLLLGIVLLNSENNIPIFLHSRDSYPDELWFPKYFKEPIWDEIKCTAIIA